MAFKKSWDVQQICNEISRCAVQMNSSYNDGFTQWGCKKELYRIKFFLDEILDKSAKFVGEDNFLDEIAKEKLVRILKNDI